MTGNCPKCSEPITKVIGCSIQLEEPHGRTDGMAYLCPNCSAVVSISAEVHVNGKGFARTHNPGRKSRAK
jgi:hypothetical protein